MGAGRRPLAEDRRRGEDPQSQGPTPASGARSGTQPGFKALQSETTSEAHLLMRMCELAPRLFPMVARAAAALCGLVAAAAALAV
jgi:hypothetical protein